MNPNPVISGVIDVKKGAAALPVPMEEEMIQVGCLRCKSTPAKAAATQFAQRTLEEIFDELFGLLQGQAKEHLNIDIGDDLHAKLVAWGEKQGLFLKEAQAKVAILEKKLNN